jgi:hypothetical protein
MMDHELLEGVGGNDNQGPFDQWIQSVLKNAMSLDH